MHFCYCVLKVWGFMDTDVLLLYFIFNITASIFSIPLGRLSDKFGRKKLLVSGYLVFSAVYLGFAIASSQAVIIAAFILYGLYTAMIVGVERAYIAENITSGIEGDYAWNAFYHCRACLVACQCHCRLVVEWHRSPGTIFIRLRNVVSSRLNFTILHEK